MRLRESGPREPELAHPPLEAVLAEPPAGAGGIGGRCGGFFLSNSWESWKRGMSPGRAGSGGVVK